MVPIQIKSCLDSGQIGRILLKQAQLPWLEAFSGNALYYGRGNPMMKQYKTVKEVCALTGLTRKHLYYFHHAKVVQAVAYANYSVEGNDGYKLYDEPAVEKLQQIALYYQLGLKRDEIRDIMLDPNYDSNRILSTLLALEREKRLRIDRHIAALEYLTLAGTKNGISGVLRGLPLEELGRMLLALREEKPKQLPCDSQPGWAECFAQELDTQLESLSQMHGPELQTPAGAERIQRILTVSGKYLGADSTAFVLGLFVSVLGGGAVAQGLARQLTPDHGRAVIQYIIEKNIALSECK